LTQALTACGIAKRVGLKHYLSSVYRVDQFRDISHFASKLAVEVALRETEDGHDGQTYDTLYRAHSTVSKAERR
jgi:hypothetical protein